MPDKSAQRGAVPSVPITVERAANDLRILTATSYAVEHNGSARHSDCGTKSCDKRRSRNSRSFTGAVADSSTMLLAGALITLYGGRGEVVSRIRRRMYAIGDSGPRVFPRTPSRIVGTLFVYSVRTERGTHCAPVDS
jgi:hypothetical protein